MSDVEQEQIDEIKAWWSEYGNYVIGAVVLGVAVIFGFNRYTAHEVAQQEGASDLFEVLADHIADGRLEGAEEVAAQMVAEYGSTAYAAQSRMAMARLYMDKSRDQDAVDSLTALLDSDADSSIKDIARGRLARVLLYQDKAAEVIEHLENNASSAFAGVYAELRGDAYVALGQYELARDAYFEALNDASQASTVDRQLVTIKLNDVPSEAVVAENSDAESAPADEADDSDDMAEADVADEAVE
ncbi:MAG: tetratricopeptide repeat protein [Pseudomonadota bacterium]